MKLLLFVENMKYGFDVLSSSCEVSWKWVRIFQSWNGERK
jgi:hypothetical protein